MSPIREHVPHAPNGYPVVVKHAHGIVTLIPGDSSMRGATIDCPYDSCRNGKANQ